MSTPAAFAYPYIVAWGRMMGSNWSFTELTAERAARDDAPSNAIYHDGGRWVTFDEVTSDATRDAINRLLPE